MDLYEVTIRYSLLTNDGVTQSSLVIKRKANKASDAIATVSSLFGALSNYTDELGNKYLTVIFVSANKIS